MNESCLIGVSIFLKGFRGLKTSFNTILAELYITAASKPINPNNHEPLVTQTIILGFISCIDSLIYSDLFQPLLIITPITKILSSSINSNIPYINFRLPCKKSVGFMAATCHSFLVRLRILRVFPSLVSSKYLTIFG